MKQDINPKMAIAVVGVILAVVAGGYYFATSKAVPQKTVTGIPVEQLEDKDPPKRGQPGYRQRTTDEPLPGNPDTAQPARGGRPGDTD